MSIYMWMDGWWDALSDFMTTFYTFCDKTYTWNEHHRDFKFQKIRKCVFHVKDIIVSRCESVKLYTKSTIKQDNGSLKCFNYNQQLRNVFFFLHETYSVMELNQLKPGYWITNFRLIFYANDKFEYIKVLYGL